MTTIGTLPSSKCLDSRFFDPTGLTCAAMPQACLAYTGWNVGYYGLREGIDWATPRTSGLGRNALILGRTLLDVGGIVTGSAFIREDFHAIGQAWGTPGGWKEIGSRFGSIGINSALGIPLFKGIGAACRSRGLAGELAAETTEASRLNVLRQRIPSIYGLDPSDVRIEAASEFVNSAGRRIPVSAGYRYGNTIYLNSKFVNGGARRLADIALHEGMHLRDFQLGNAATQRLLQWAEFWTPKSPLTELWKIWPYVAMPSEIAARSAGVYYISNNLLIDILPRSAYAFVQYRR